MTELPNEATLRKLFGRHYEPVVHFFARRGFSESEAQDLAQETFLVAFKAIDKLRDPPRARAWLFAIAMNVWRNELRSRQAIKRGSEEESLEIGHDDEVTIDRAAPDALDGFLNQERRARLASAISELPPQMRRTLLLRIDRGLKYREIAAVLGVSIDTVKSQLAQARTRLQQELGQTFSDTGDD